MSNSFCIIYCSRKVVRAEIVQQKKLICSTICNTLFEKVTDIKGLRPYTETQKSHRQGRAIVRPCLF